MGVTRRFHPFWWQSQPAFALQVGVSETYNLAQHIQNPHGLTLTYSIHSGSINGVSVNPTTGLVTYTGADALSGALQFAVSANGYLSESSAIAIDVTPAQVGNQAPVWTTVPSITFTEGTSGTYNLAQHASDPDNDPITYALATGTLPAGVTLSADGVLSYDGVGADGSAVVTVDASDAQLTSQSAAFTDIPEIVFLSGYAQTEQLGIFHLDPNNRWTPGDLTRTAASHRTGLPWTTTASIELVDAVTLAPISDAYVALNPFTLELNYTGVDTGAATHDLSVRLRDADTGEVSPEFRVRVLRAKILYGAGASTHASFSYLPAGSKFDSDLGATFAQAKNALTAGGDAIPGVLVHLGGAYGNVDRFIGARRFLYVLGEPGNRPVLTGDAFAFSDIQTAYIKGFELVNCRITETGNRRTDVGSAIYVTDCYQHDQTAADNGVMNVNSTAPEARPCRVWIWNFEGKGNGYTDNTLHQIYIEGRPALQFCVNNVHINGSNGCSAIKSTCQNVYVWNSDIAGVRDEANPSTNVATQASTILLDVPAVSNIISYNNRFAIFSSASGGQQNGALFWRARKPGVRGSDIPAYPNVDYDAGTTSQTTMSAPPGWTSGTETYKSDAFWTAVASIPITSGANPLAFRHFVSYNRFELLTGSNQTRVLRDDGTHPVEPDVQFGDAVILPTHNNWSERSVTFLANNRYTGWSANPPVDMTDYEVVNRVEDDSTQGSPKWRTNLSNPGNGRQVQANYTQVGGAANTLTSGVGGELVGAGTFSPIDLPSYFQIARVTPVETETTALQAAISAIPGPYQFASSPVDCPDLGELVPRLDPFNVTGSDYPDAAGDAVTNGHTGTNGARAWIWAGKAVWHAASGRAVFVASPHPADVMGPSGPCCPTPGLFNPWLAMLTTYTESDGGFRVYEGPLSDDSTRDLAGWPRSVAHAFDNCCLVGDTLYKGAQPATFNQAGFTQQTVGNQIAKIDLSLVTGDVTSARGGAAYVGSIQMTDNDITAGGLDYLPGLGKLFHGHKDRYWLIDPTTGAHTPNDATGTPLGFTVATIHNIANYHPNRGQLLYGGGALAGVGQNLQWVIVDGTTGAVTAVDDSPVCISMSETDVGGDEVKGVVVADPNSREWIAFHDNGNIYGCDPDRPAGSQWRVITTIADASNGIVPPIDWACSVWGRGAILCGKSAANGAAKLYVFRGA